MPPGPDNAARDGPTPSLSGKLAAISLFDLCQFLMLNRKTGTLTVRSGGGTSYFTFFEGQLCTALDDGLREDAEVVLRTLQRTEGSFEFAQGAVSPDRRMNASTENILLEAARRIDEMQAEAPASGRTDAAGSAERAFREKQARAASIVDAFRNLVAEGDRSRAAEGWREMARARLLEPAVERLILSAEGRAGFLVGGRFEEIPEAIPAEVSTWMDQLAPPLARTSTRSGHLRTEPPEARPGADDLWGLRVETVEGDLVFVTRTRRTWPEMSALPLTPEERAALVDTRSGLVAVLGSAGASPSAWPAWEGVAAWLAHRSVNLPACGWIIEEMPRFDWSQLPGRRRQIAPARLRRPGALDRLTRTARSSVLVFDGLPSPALAEEATRLGAAGVLVVIVDAAERASTWLAAAERPGLGTADRGGVRFAATVVVRIQCSPDGSSLRTASLFRPRPSV
jgi:hypothetical protein